MQSFGRVSDGSRLILQELTPRDQCLEPTDNKPSSLHTIDLMAGDSLNDDWSPSVDAFVELDSQPSKTFEAYASSLVDLDAELEALLDLDQLDMRGSALKQEQQCEYTGSFSWEELIDGNDEDNEDSRPRGKSPCQEILFSDSMTLSYSGPGAADVQDLGKALNAADEIDVLDQLLTETSALLLN